MSLRTRLRYLERTAGDANLGCPACRERCGFTAIVTAQRLSDGSTAPEGDRPAPCEACGEVPEQIIELIHTVVETREDMARPEAEERASLARPIPPHTRARRP